MEFKKLENNQKPVTFSSSVSTEASDIARYCDSTSR